MTPNPDRSPGAAPGAARLDAWLRELRLEPVGSAERDGISSRDLVLDGRRRRGIRLTLILAPDVGLVAWVHYASAPGDGLRRTYRQLLKWNDELPFVKFGLSADDDVVLSAELAPAGLDADALGRTVARLVAVCDLLQEASAGFLKSAPGPAETTNESTAEHAGGGGAAGPTALLERYAPDLAELDPSRT
ncbi:MAG: YbjN domain-containing protein [Candidatus Limnocylindrales bacterium]